MTGPYSAMGHTDSCLKMCSASRTRPAHATRTPLLTQMCSYLSGSRCEGERVADERFLVVDGCQTTVNPVLVVY